MPDQPEVIRASSGRSVFLAMTAAFFGLGAVAIALLFASAHAWAGLIVIVPLVLAVAFIAWRASRCRLEIWTEQLVVVNSFTTHRIRRDELLGVDEQSWSELTDATRTVELRTLGGNVRVAALARTLQARDELRHHLGRLEEWRIGIAP